MVRKRVWKGRCKREGRDKKEEGDRKREKWRKERDEGTLVLRHSENWSKHIVQCLCMHKTHLHYTKRQICHEFESKGLHHLVQGDDELQRERLNCSCATVFVWNGKWANSFY